MKSCRMPFSCAHLLPKKYIAFTILTLLLSYSLFSLFANAPASTNYRLDEWAVGGGGDKSQSSNYQTQITNDPLAGEAMGSTNYRLNPGLLFVEMANVPPAPAITNPDNYYNKLHLVINAGSNPTDSTFAVAISTDNFVSTTYYVKADNTVGTTLTASDWRTYASWGGATGIDILGLTSDTTYYVKVKAEQGDFTETPWGPIASAATSPASLSFDIDTAATDIETSAPYIVALGQLNTGAVTTATDKIWTDFATNAGSGGVVYVAGQNNGLESTVTGYTIPGVSSDLSAQPEGFGLVTSSITQSSGGPFQADTPFAGSGNTVGATGTTLIPLATSLYPLIGGRHALDVKTIISTLTPAATDYTETLTIVAAAT
jgi:hypothetical protein